MHELVRIDTLLSRLSAQSKDTYLCQSTYGRVGATESQRQEKPTNWGTTAADVLAFLWQII